MNELPAPEDEIENSVFSRMAHHTLPRPARHGSAFDTVSQQDHLQDRHLHHGADEQVSAVRNLTLGSLTGAGSGTGTSRADRSSGKACFSHAQLPFIHKVHQDNQDLSALQAAADGNGKSGEHGSDALSLTLCTSESVPLQGPAGSSGSKLGSVFGPPHHLFGFPPPNCNSKERDQTAT